MYEQSLYSIIEPIKINTIKRLNKAKKWKYGYNKENDVIVISKTGEIGDVYSIQNLKVALPPVPKNLSKNNNKWEVQECPKELEKLKTIFDWKDLPVDYKNNKWRYTFDLNDYKNLNDIIFFLDINPITVAKIF